MGLSQGILSWLILFLFSIYAGISELSRSGALMPYPTLIEISGGAVSQAEAEIVVEKDGCEVVTK